MKSTQAWFQRQPLPVFFAAVFVLWVGMRLVLALQRIDAVHVLSDVIGGLIFAGIATALVAARRRRLGGREHVVEYLRAVRSGVLPAGVDEARWRAALDHDRRAAVRSRWSLPAVTALPVGLGIVLLLLDPADPGLATVLIALFVVLGAVGVVTTERRRKKLDSLIDQLSSARAASTPSE